MKEALLVVQEEKVPVDELTLSGQPFVFSILFFGFGTKFLSVPLSSGASEIAPSAWKRTSICLPGIYM